MDTADLEMIQNIIDVLGVAPAHVDKDAYDIDKSGSVTPADKTLLQSIITVCPTVESKFAAAAAGDTSVCGIITELSGGELELLSYPAYYYSSDDRSQVHAQLKNNLGEHVFIKSMSFTDDLGTVFTQTFPYAWVIPPGESLCVIGTFIGQMNTGYHYAYIKYSVPSRFGDSYIEGDIDPLSVQTVADFGSTGSSCHQEKGDGDGNRRIGSADQTNINLIATAQPFPSYFDLWAYDIANTDGYVDEEDQDAMDSIIENLLCNTLPEKFAAAAEGGDTSGCS
ncbi:MAG: hypothetical protein KKE20_07125 [Nanoarchaeota archaeon]|nr:hypothetical protein [Nanoarchaeota archaeon]